MHLNNWTKPAYHKATAKFFKLQRACEEILRLSVEIQRLYTTIHDEEIAVLTAIHDLTKSDPYLALKMQRWWQEHAAVNVVHLHHLKQIQRLPGFSGMLTLGFRDVEKYMPINTVGDLEEGLPGFPRASAPRICDIGEHTLMDTYHRRPGSYTCQWHRWACT